MVQESNTKILWRKAKAGDQAAFEQLFAMHAEPLLAFVRSRLGGALRDKLEPEDILQDAYLAALKCFDDFEYTDEGAFRRWMCRIIDNRMRDSHDYFAAKKRQEAPLPPSPLTGPLTAFGRMENRQRIEAALAMLSLEHREVLLLRYYEGLSAEQAGVRMQRTAGAIRNLSARALVELARHLGKSLEP